MNPTVCSSGQKGMSSEFPSARRSQSIWEWRCPWSEYWRTGRFFRLYFESVWKLNTWQEMNTVLLLLCSSTELLVVHLCGFDESAACSALLDITSVTEIRYPSDTQVDRKERWHSDQSQLSDRQEVIVQLRHIKTQTHIIFLFWKTFPSFSVTSTHFWRFTETVQFGGSEP